MLDLLKNPEKKESHTHLYRERMWKTCRMLCPGTPVPRSRDCGGSGCGIAAGNSQPCRDFPALHGRTMARWLLHQPSAPKAAVINKSQAFSCVSQGFTHPPQPSPALTPYIKEPQRSQAHGYSKKLKFLCLFHEFWP